MQDANVDAAGLRKFGTGQAEALEQAFKVTAANRMFAENLTRLMLTACSPSPAFSV